jgi:hypothetical protein
MKKELEIIILEYKIMKKEMEIIILEYIIILFLNFQIELKIIKKLNMK